MSKILETLTKSLIETYAEKRSYQEKEELIKSLEVLANHAKYNKFESMFPDTGEFSRDKYVKHMEFIKAGSSFRERLLIAGNRVGKSELGAYELTCHATGNYPEWWVGKRFTRPIKAWIGGDTSTTVRDIIQQKLLGTIGDFGSGMLNKSLIKDTRPRRNVPDAIETILVQHKSGGVSTIVLKTYEQGRETWQGTEIDLIWLDEEPPLEIYSEALIRTMTTNGMVMLTFTPLRGLSDVVLSFMETDDQAKKSTSKCTITATWADAPHLTEQAKDELRASIPPNERDARENGNPVLGSGRIYPFSLDSVVVTDFQIPKYYAKAYGMDVGWNKTAAVFGALDRDNDILYIYSEHYAGEAEPMFHAKAIRARGEWMKGVIDPASHGRSQVDGSALFDMYTKEGLKVRNAENAVEAGIFEVWQRFQTGRLKIFKSCTNLLKELSLYHRNEKGAIVKKNDHLCLSKDTLVKTQLGYVKLSDITEGIHTVVNRFNKYVPTSSASIVKKDVEFVELITQNGNIKATPDHCFLGENGVWYPACITKGINLLDMEATWKTQESSQIVNKSLTERPTGNVDSIFNDTERDYIEQYGKLVMEPLVKSLKYIILMATDTTTELRTWKSSTSVNTQLTILENELKKEVSSLLHKLVETLQLSGMDQTKDEIGIDSTMKRINTICINELSVPAAFVESYTQLLDYMVTEVFAQITADPLIEGIQESIISNALVVFVEKNLLLTDTLLRRLALQNVANKAANLVVDVKRIQTEDAWCVYVPEGHEFEIEGGLISSNCDCLRYLVLSGLRVASCQLEVVPRKDNVVNWNAWS